MDTSKNGAAIIKRILGNRNNLLIIALLGAVLLILAMPTKQEESGLSYGNQAEKEEETTEEVEGRLERILEDTEGVGKVKVMITGSEEKTGLAEDEDTECDVEGVVVVAQGAENAAVKKKIQDIVLALFPIEAHKIEIVKMEAD